MFFSFCSLNTITLCDKAPKSEGARKQHNAKKQHHGFCLGALCINRFFSTWISSRVGFIVIEGSARIIWDWKSGAFFTSGLPEPSLSDDWYLLVCCNRRLMASNERRVHFTWKALQKAVFVNALAQL